MRQKHKKSHAQPIVPKHATAPTGAKLPASPAQQHAQNQHHQQHAAEQKGYTVNGVAQQGKNMSLLGKRTHAAQQQGNTTNKPLHQPERTNAAKEHAGQQNKKQRLQDVQQGENSCRQSKQQQPQQRTGSDKQRQHTGDTRQPAVASKHQQLRHKQQGSAPQQSQQANRHQAVEQQQFAKQPLQHAGTQQQQQGKRRKHAENHNKPSELVSTTAAQVNGAASNAAGPQGSPSMAATSTAAGPNGGPTAVATAAPTASSKRWQPKQPTAVSSNWQALQQQLKQQAAAQPRRPRKRKDSAAGDKAATNGSSSNGKKQIRALGHNKAVTPIVAMDCEMVGVGPGGERDSLARVSIVNASGNVLYDSYVAQREPVTDYRTWVSGITPANLLGAPDISTVQKQVTELLQGRVLVGHGVKKDLSVLMLSHPRKHIRDTAKYPPFMFSKAGKRRPRALKLLAQQELGLSIQEGQHSSVDDARAALYLYQKHAGVWEKALKTPHGIKQLPTANRPVKKKRVESYSLRDVKDDPLADL